MNLNIDSMVGKRIRYWDDFHRNVMIYTDAVILGGYLAVEQGVTQPYLIVRIEKETYHSDNPTKNADSITTIRMHSRYIKFGWQDQKV